MISLNGSGTIRATYYNKGSFDMFGTYLVDHGSYNLTIQNVIKKDFIFQQGGTIIFGGDPFNASLNLQALYTVNGVPLSDLNIGNSFSNNNTRVDCIMNITGNPSGPRVDFDLDLPTVSSDAKQMVRSIINSQEEMNMQVIYLLGIGRFYTEETNNAGRNGEQQSQASLAMQSILSGTISQQINSVLSSMFRSSNWNFGANISTGDEGWNNAEYEGFISGRLLNNRLLINGQFGYRDNANRHHLVHRRLRHPLPALPQRKLGHQGLQPNQRPVLHPQQSQHTRLGTHHEKRLQRTGRPFRPRPTQSQEAQPAVKAANLYGIDNQLTLFIRIH